MVLSFLFNRFTRVTSSGLYLPEIDGLRFLAIMLVVLFHIYGYFIDRTPFIYDNITLAPNKIIDSLFKSANKGVQLFFIISGFILSLPFVKYYTQAGKPVELKSFYLRRLTRLEPPYIIAILLLFIGQLLVHKYHINYLFASLLASLTYTHNIFMGPPLITVVAWSLEIEVQFYLLAPLLARIFLLNCNYRRAILVSTMLLVPVLNHIFPLPVLTLYNYFHFFAAGILLADLYINNSIPTALLNSRNTVFAGFVCLVVIFSLNITGNILQTIVFTLVSTCFYFIVLNNQLWKTVFSNKVISTIGGMCYSIYLLHYAIISLFGRFTINFMFTKYFVVNLLVQMIINCAIILLISSFYYLYIERPFMTNFWVKRLRNQNVYVGSK